MNHFNFLFLSSFCFSSLVFLTCTGLLHLYCTNLSFHLYIFLGQYNVLLYYNNFNVGYVTEKPSLGVAINVCMYVCMYVVGMYACMYVCRYLCMYACMYVCKLNI